MTLKTNKSMHNSLKSSSLSRSRNVIPMLGPSSNLLRNAMANDAPSMKTKIQNIVLRYAELGGYNTQYANFSPEENDFF